MTAFHNPLQKRVRTIPVQQMNSKKNFQRCVSHNIDTRGKFSKITL